MAERRTPDPNATAYVVSTRGATPFRRVGRTFTPVATTIPAAALTTAQRELLLNGDPGRPNPLIVEEIVQPPAAASLPSPPNAVPPAAAASPESEWVEEPVPAEVELEETAPDTSKKGGRHHRR